jgi:hypothetical protein
MAIRSALLSRCVCAALAAVGAGCGSSSSSGPAPSRIFVGQVEGSDARLALIATEHNARIFFCGGDTTYKSMTHWIPSAPIDVKGDVMQPSDTAGWAIHGQVESSGVSGVVIAHGDSTFTFHAAPVATATIAGVYEVSAPCGKVGLIVAQGSAGEVPVGQGACVPASGNADPEQVNPILPIARAADGTIPVVIGGTKFFVHPAAAPD